MATHWFRAITLACLIFASLAASAGTPEDPILFESSAPGLANGGIGVSDTFFPGHTFRLTQRAHISAVGTQLSSFNAVSVFAGLYRIGTPVSPADVVNDSNLVAVTLLDVPAGGVATEVSGTMDVDLDPGWYALIIGQGRHGATATNFNVTLKPSGNPSAPQSWGPYSVNTSSGQLVLQGTTARLFVRGQLLPSEPPPAGGFLLETARPAAWWGSSYVSLREGLFVGRRFTLTRPARLDRVSTWLYVPSEPVFAAIFPLASAGSLPPLPTNPDFENLALAGALTETASFPEECSADFGGLELPAGHYALVLGTGKFGATGSGGVITVSDEIVTPGSLYIDLDQSSSWFQQSSFSLSMRLSGSQPDLATDPTAVDFGAVPVGATATRSVTLSNLRPDPLAISGMQLTGTSAARFAVVDAGDCSDLAGGAQCSFDIEYQPTVVGDDEAVLEIDSDGVPDPYSLSLSGSGLASAVVTPSAGANGSIDPADAQIVALGATPGFVLSPAAGYHIDTVTGTCGGTLAGQVFTTDPVAADCTVQVQFALDPATALSVLAGTPQSAEVATSFGTLVVLASNDAGLPVPGTLVEFTSPPTGASAVLPASVSTDALGRVEVEAVANTIAGSYTVEAQATGIAAPAVFELANLPGPAEQLQVVSGDAQTALVGEAFALPLSVRVGDSYGNAVASVAVDFSAPGSGASATLSDSSALSGGDGIATIGATANAVPGEYNVTASAGALDPVAIALVNRPPVLALSIAIDDETEYVRYGQIVDYLVTIQNAGTDAAIGVSLQVPLPEQIDAGAALWTCLDLESGCIAEGAGSLQDGDLQVAAGASVRWLLSAPVRTDAAGDRVDMPAAIDATYHPPVDAVDQDWLVLFREGFDETEPGAPDEAEAGAKPAEK